MNWFRQRTALATVLAASLVACGGGDSGSNPGPIGGGGGGSGGGGGGSTSCSLADRKQFAFDVIDEFYLFPDLIARDVNPADAPTVQDYINQLVAPARAQSKDRFFSYITSIEEENEAASGQTAGFGIRLSYDSVNSRVYVVEAFENGPAFAAGIDRGTEILAINGESVTSLFAAGGTGAVSDALGPSDPGVARTLRFENTDGTTRELSITKADYTLNPLSNRYGVEIINDNGRQVGYINLRTFFSNLAPNQLRSGFAQLNQQGVTEVILDLRYNSGGFISVAETLGDLMAKGRAGEVFSKTIFRPSRASENTTDLFGSEPNAIRVTKLAVIATNSTASASELVTNAFIPYLGNDIALIGSDSFGKPVGQEAFDRPACDDRLRIVSLKTVNANNQGEYYTGLASVMPNTCRADDDIFTPFGNANEDSIATALDFLAGRSCTPISASGVQNAQGGSRRQALRAEEPTAIQHEIPGLY